MAQFNQLQTSASQVVNPPVGYVSFHFDETEKLNFFDSTGPIAITASIMAESASVAESAHRFTAGTKVITGSLIVNGDLQAQSFTLSSSVISSLILTNSGSSTFGNDLADQHKFSGSFSVTGSALIKGNTVITGSTINNGNFSVVNGAISGSLISGSSATITEISASSISILTASVNNLTVFGTASIKYLDVVYETASFIYLTGSTKFGDETTDVHQFTGSVGISGSLITDVKTLVTLANVQASGSFTGSFAGTYTGSFSGSFSGSGHQLVDISASSIVGLNLTLIGTSSVSASTSNASGFVVTSIASGSTFSGSVRLISGSLTVQSSSITVNSGSIFVNNNYTGSNIFGTSSWAMDAVFGGAVVTVSGSYPTSQRNVNTGSASGSLWWNTNDGNLYIQAAGPSGSTWVPAVSSVAGGTFGATYTDVETTASVTWSIDHGLNTLTPIVQVYTGSQVMVPASIRSVNVNRTEITFATATAGTAIVSTGVGGPTSASFAATSNLAATASYLNGSIPTLVQAQNTSGQSINHNVASPSTTVTGWTNMYTQNAAEWNAAAGTFTAAKAGVYSVSANLTYTDKAAALVGNVVNVQVVKNSTAQAVSTMAADTTSSTLKGTGTATSVVSLAIGDTISIRTYHNMGTAGALITTAGLNNVTIQQIASSITG